MRKIILLLILLSFPVFSQVDSNTGAYWRVLRDSVTFGTGDTVTVLKAWQPNPAFDMLAFASAGKAGPLYDTTSVSLALTNAASLKFVAADSVVLRDNASIFNRGVRDWTWSWVFSMPDTSSTFQLGGAGNSTSSARAVWFRPTVGANTVFRFRVRLSDDPDINYDPPDAWPLNEPIVVTCVADRLTADKTYLYWNGVLVDSATTTDAVTNVDNTIVSIGGFYGGSGWGNVNFFETQFDTIARDASWAAAYYDSAAVRYLPPVVVTETRKPILNKLNSLKGLKP